MSSMFVVCKYADCNTYLSTDMVLSVSDIPRAPQHIAVLAQCAACLRRGQYVIERSRWEEEQDVDTAVQAAVDERIMNAAAIELDAVENVHDLQLVWASYGPPIIEERMGECPCYECWKRYYG